MKIKPLRRHPAEAQGTKPKPPPASPRAREPDRPALMWSLLLPPRWRDRL
jgi:hypothetical protein